MKRIKIIALVLLSIAVVWMAKYVYAVHLNYNLKTITEGKVYSSGVIPPEKIKDYVKDYNIKTIIDFRHPHVIDELNPGKGVDIDEERKAVAAIEGVRHVNIPSDQVPTPQNLERLFEVLDQKEAYPVLMHCYHGTGRAQIYSAIYRIEYEGMSNQKAREGTRFLLKYSSFDDGKPKGEFLKAYKKRK